MRVSLANIIEKRITHLSSWLSSNGRFCVNEQLHLVKDSRERVYFKYGYLMALKDMQKLSKEIEK